MDAVQNLGRAKTVIMIAHRLTHGAQLRHHLHDGAGQGGRRGQLRRAARAQPELPGDGGRGPGMSRLPRPAPAPGRCSPSSPRASTRSRRPSSPTTSASSRRGRRCSSARTAATPSASACRCSPTSIPSSPAGRHAAARRPAPAPRRPRAGAGAPATATGWPPSCARSGVGVVLAEFGNTGATVAEVCAELGLPLFVCFRGHDATMHKRYASMERRYRRLFGQARGPRRRVALHRRRAAAIGCPEALVEVIPSGVDPARFPPGRPEPGRILAVGRLVEMKAPHLTLAGLRRGGAGASRRRTSTSSATACCASAARRWSPSAASAAG